MAAKKKASGGFRYVKLPISVIKEYKAAQKKTKKK